MTVISLQDTHIPAVGLGTWELRGRACSRIVEQAIRLGYRHIDTAQMYENEREVGEGVRASGVKRSEVFVTTKVWPTHFAPNDLIRSVKDSLMKLRMTEADLILLHWPSTQVPLSETLGALAQVKRDGMARHIGVSNFTVALMNEAVGASPEPLVCNQFEYHPKLDQTAVLAGCAAHQLIPVAYCPIGRGRLKDDETLSEIASAHGKSVAQVALRWLFQQNVVAIPRTSRVERLSENIDIFDFELSDDEMARILALGSAKDRLTNPAIAPAWD